MKKTIKELQTELKNLKEEYYNRYLTHKKFPEWVAANEKVTQARRELQEVEKRINPEVLKMENECQRRMREINSELEQRQSEKNQSFPAEIIDWVRNKYAGGKSYGYGSASKPDLVWLSEDHKYGILRARGGQTWVGRGTFAYAGSEYWAIEIFSNPYRDITQYGDARFSGRLTKEKKQQLIDEIYKIVKK